MIDASPFVLYDSGTCTISATDNQTLSYQSEFGYLIYSNPSVPTANTMLIDLVIDSKSYVKSVKVLTSEYTISPVSPNYSQVQILLNCENAFINYVSIYTYRVISVTEFASLYMSILKHLRIASSSASLASFTAKVRKSLITSGVELMDDAFTIYVKYLFGTEVKPPVSVIDNNDAKRTNFISPSSYIYAGATIPSGSVQNV